MNSHGNNNVYTSRFEVNDDMPKPMMMTMKNNDDDEEDDAKLFAPGPRRRGQPKRPLWRRLPLYKKLVLRN